MTLPLVCYDKYQLNHNGLNGIMDTYATRIIFYRQKNTTLRLSACGAKELT